jgi:hypothetical protein
VDEPRDPEGCEKGRAGIARSFFCSAYEQQTNSVAGKAAEKTRLAAMN